MQSTLSKAQTEISDSELLEFSLFIRDNYGLRLDWYNKTSLKRRLSRVLSLNRISNLSHLTLLLAKNRDYFRRFTESFTVQVTELFREPKALRELKTSVFPFLSRILHPKILIVGCSSGEEMISLCILLEEAGLLNKSSITVTDISQKAIDKAKQFLVSKTKIEHAQMNYRQAGGETELSNFYQSTSSMCYFNEYLFQNVEWSLFDITQSELLSHFDLVICKNVLIYFNHTHQGMPLARLVRHLSPGGFLALGEQESMAFYKNEGFLIQTVSSEFKIYRKSLNQL